MRSWRGAYVVARLLVSVGAVVKPPHCAGSHRHHSFHPSPTSTVPRPSLFAFAQSLFTAGEYYRAIGEFQRFLFFQPEHPLAAEAQLTIGLALFLRGALATGV